MAGVGFELNRLMKQKTYTSLLRAYGLAGVIAGGPWIIAVSSMALLGYLLERVTSEPDVRIFLVAISVIYGTSLVAVGPFQMIMTRYTSDQLYKKETDPIFGCFLQFLSWGAIILFVLGVFMFYFFVEANLLFRGSSAMLFVLVGCIWLCSVFLSGIKNYRELVRGFFVGFVLCILFGWGLGHISGIGGAMFGMVLGHLIIFLHLIKIIYLETGLNFHAKFDSCITIGRKYYQLAFCGLFYNLGIWIDKFLFWWADPKAVQISGFLYSAPVYDPAVYFSFLSILPGISFFLLKVETGLVYYMADFIDKIINRGSLGQIQEAKRKILDSLTLSIGQLIKLQGLVTGILILSAGNVLDILDLNDVQTGVFQISLLGAFVLVIFMALLLVLYYMDKKNAAMITCMSFMITNALVTLVSISMGVQYYGLGFLSATVVGLLVALYFVEKNLDYLEIQVFMKQPI